MTIRTYVYKLPFDEVYDQLKSNIQKEGLVLLHEIDTQLIVAKFGIPIKPLKQILFFHPKYIERILKEDNLAINEVPIKMVVYELGKNLVQLSFPDLGKRLEEYGLSLDFIPEINIKIEKIIALE